MGLQDTFLALKQAFLIIPVNLLSKVIINCYFYIVRPVICLIILVNWLAWQGYLAGSSETAPRILKFSIAMGADYSSELMFMPIMVLAFCAHNNSFLDPR